MKLSSIIVSGLIGTSVLMFSGCSTDPEKALTDLTDQLLDEASIYSVILVNDTDGNVTFSGVSRETEYQIVQSKNSDSFAFNGAIDVSYSGGDTVTFQKGYSHIYAATHCNGHNHLSGNEDANNLQVLNLTGSDFGAGTLLVKENNDSTPISGALYGDCAITTTSTFNSVEFKYGTEISVDGGAHYKTVRQINPEFVNLGDEMKYCLIAYDDGNLSFVPLAKIDWTQLNLQP